LRICFVSPSAKDFDFFAEGAFWFGRQCGGCTVVAEEIANVTSPGKAAAGWHRLISQGLEFGIDIHAITQRPAESDKTCIGNCSVLRTFPMRRANDRRYIAAELDVHVDTVNDLKEAHYLSRDMKTGALREGRLSFAGRKVACKERAAAVTEELGRV
jgi:hypothetical protein